MILNALIIYLRFLLPKTFSCLPSGIGRAVLKAGLRGIAPCRVYLISLQPDLYILSVALVLNVSGRPDTNGGRYPLHCPVESGLSSLPLGKSDKATCSTGKGK